MSNFLVDAQQPDDDEPMRIATNLLEVAPLRVTLQLAVSSSLAYFLVYFLRYPIIMLGDDVLEQPFATIFGTTITLHTALSMTFSISFGLAKIPALMVMTSNVYFQHRFMTLAFLNSWTAALVTLPLALSNGNPTWTVLGYFFGLFTSSWVYGGFVAYFEGRCATETILAINTIAFIFAGSASRGVGDAMVQSRVMKECWVPFTISATVILPIIIFSWFMDRSPPPSTQDVAMRRPRRAMSAADRKEFVVGFWPGLICLVLAYAMLSGVRGFRDQFTTQIFTAANGGKAPSSFFFFIVDLPGSFVAGGFLLLFPMMKNNSNALQTMLIVMAAFLAASMLLTALFQAGVLTGEAWQVLLGITLYGAYAVAGSAAIFDRIVACSPMTGATCTFLVFSADLSGYVFTLSILMWKTFSAGNQDDDTVLNQFIDVLYVGCTAMIICLVGCLWYFHRRLAGYIQ